MLWDDFLCRKTDRENSFPVLLQQELMLDPELQAPPDEMSDVRALRGVVLPF